MTSPELALVPPLGRLAPGAALREGWRAFCLAPWPFVGFTLLLNALVVVSSLLPVVGTLVSLVITFWGAVGLYRGAWSALEGRRPDWRCFSRWDGAAVTRIFLAGLLIAALCLLVLLPTLLLGFGLWWIKEALVLLPALVAVLGLVLLSCSQQFLQPVLLFQETDPFVAMGRSHRVLIGQWQGLLELITLLFLLGLAGLLALGVGVFVAQPLVACVQIAAFRQLFGHQDRTGVMAA
ncbi:MAG: hypothetical protein ACOYLI_09365 [Synechococcus lacustris]